MNNQKGVKIIKGGKSKLETAGSYNLFTCINGKNKDTIYSFSGNRAIFGRSTNADIQVLDKKCSREHAELKMIGDNVIVSDLGSHNGIFVNDLKVSQYTLVSGDNLLIGGTLFKYESHFIEATELVQRSESEVSEEIDGEFKETKKTNEKKKNKRIIYIIGIFVVIMFMFDEEAPVEDQSTTRSIQKANLESKFSKYLKKKRQKEDKEVLDKINNILHRGLREYREGNYYRAIEEFNLALRVSPENGRAVFYLNKTKQKLDEEIEIYFIKAKKQYDSLKIRGALNTYCNIIRLIQDNPDDSRYVDAKANIESIEDELGLLKGETKCIEEGRAGRNRRSF